MYPMTNFYRNWSYSEPIPQLKCGIGKDIQWECFALHTNRTFFTGVGLPIYGSQVRQVLVYAKNAKQAHKRIRKMMRKDDRLYYP